ncbi:hypothetical protein KUTeg_009734, partial [Tegillarca granosa]
MFFKTQTVTHGSKGDKGDRGPIGQIGTTGSKAKIKLAGSPSMYMGRVEVYHNDQWGTVIGTSFSSAHFGSGTGQIWLDDVRCAGSEISLNDCSHRNWGIENCDHAEDAGVMCGNVRLVGVEAPNPFSGRVEVYHDGEWGTVCDDSFDIPDAKAVCSAIGLAGGTVFDPPDGHGMIWMDDVACTGKEVSIEECSHRGWGINNCQHSEDVGVRCAIVRLVNTTSATTGRVEIFHEGQWGTICDDNWDDDDASVICKMLGFSGGTAYKRAHYGSGSGKIWLDNVDCSGSEDDVSDCQHSTWGRHNCVHNEDA